MRFKLHWNTQDRKYVDYIIIGGDTIEDCRKQAKEELKKRGVPKNLAWSERINKDAL